MKFTSTVISVSNVNASRKFYQDLFGMDVSIENLTKLLS